MKQTNESTEKDILTPKQREIYDLYLVSNYDEKEVAKILNINVDSVKKTLFLAGKKGAYLVPDKFCPVAPVGFETFYSTIHTKDGEEVERWDRVKPFSQSLDSLIAYLEKRIPSVPTTSIIQSNNIQNEVCLEWTLADFHYGLLAWDKETGDDYDMNIARDLLVNSANEIFSRAGMVDTVVLALMGDNFHTDFFANMTEASKHPLSVDSRYPKIVHTGAEIFISAIEICLRHARHVKVITLYGNHDKQTSVNLQLILHYAFRNEPRVEIDLGVSKTRYHVWGITATAYHHGDMTKPSRLCSELVRHVAINDIQGVREFYAKQGHLHKELVQNIDGVTFEIVMSPVARDGHAAGSNYASKRATVATTYHKEYGQLSRYIITAASLLRKTKIIENTCCNTVGDTL